MQRYTKAPLPFLGQKRNWLKLINNLNFENAIVVDLFGGSGLLSHEIKRNNPSADVIWNDFDNYQARLDQIDITEALRIELKTLTREVAKAIRPDHKLKSEMIKVIKASGCTDYVTLSSWLLFGGNYAKDMDDLFSRGWYCRVNQMPLDKTDYHQDVKRVSMDFRELTHQYEDKENVIFIADPPYIMTNQAGYIKGKNGDHFRLRDAIALIRSLMGKKALLFSSTKSETDDLLEIFNAGDNIERIEYEASLPEGRKYTELLYKINW